MTPERMADLHARAFAPERGWTAAEFAALLASPHVRCLAHTHGFALVREIAGEAELLTLAVDPDHRRRGIAAQLMQDWRKSAQAATAFLEVAADNLAAQSLYRQHGFDVSGRRKGYYTRPDGPKVDAVIMKASLTQDHPPQSTASG